MTPIRKTRPFAPAWRMTPGKFLAYLFMYAFALLCIIPLIWLVKTAFTPQAYATDLFRLGWPTLDNFRRIWNAAPWTGYYVNTFLIVAGVLAAQFVTITLAGYAFARLDFYLKNVLFVLFLTQIMIAADVLILPNYKTVAAMGLSNRLLGVMLPFFSSAMGTFLMRQTIKTIPYELEEAARMDGCSLFTLLIRIYLPLLVPGFIAHGLIAASYQWNNFLWPLIVIDSVAKRPLTVGLAIFAQSYETGAQWSDVCSATFLVVAPLLVLFLLFQKRFIESFTYSGIK
ncbi:MAG TPA: carbohydrate ABC transporter permease [Candidatus Limnocylindria bacterium]|nr:carbohydrate ABC transporter permease [Candidatus Limnocylindria bacterium]